MRRREVAGAIQEKGRRWHMAGDRVGVPRRKQMAPSQEWGWGEEEGGGWYHPGERTEWHMAASPGEGMWVALGWDWGRVERREVADAISEKGHG